MLYALIVRGTFCHKSLNLATTSASLSSFGGISIKERSGVSYKQETDVELMAFLSISDARSVRDMVPKVSEITEDQAVELINVYLSLVPDVVGAKKTCQLGGGYNRLVFHSYFDQRRRTLPVHFIFNVNEPFPSSLLTSSMAVVANFLNDKVLLPFSKAVVAGNANTVGWVELEVLQCSKRLIARQKMDAVKSRPKLLHKLPPVAYTKENFMFLLKDPFLGYQGDKQFPARRDRLFGSLGNLIHIALGDDADVSVRLSTLDLARVDHEVQVEITESEVNFNEACRRAHAATHQTMSDDSRPPRLFGPCESAACVMKEADRQGAGLPSERASCCRKLIHAACGVNPSGDAIICKECSLLPNPTHVISDDDEYSHSDKEPPPDSRDKEPSPDSRAVAAGAGVGDASSTATPSAPISVTVCGRRYPLALPRGYIPPIPVEQQILDPHLLVETGGRLLPRAMHCIIRALIKYHDVGSHVWFYNVVSPDEFLPMVQSAGTAIRSHDFNFVPLYVKRRFWVLMILVKDIPDCLYFEPRVGVPWISRQSEFHTELLEALGATRDQIHHIVSTTPFATTRDCAPLGDSKVLFMCEVFFRMIKPIIAIDRRDVPQLFMEKHTNRISGNVTFSLQAPPVLQAQHDAVVEKLREPVASEVVFHNAALVVHEFDDTSKWPPVDVEDASTPALSQAGDVSGAAAPDSDARDVSGDAPPDSAADAEKERLRRQRRVADGPGESSGRLSHDDAACRLDRIVVYHTAQVGQTSLAALAQLLHSHGITADAQALRQSLARLQLAYVLRKQDAEYRFAIPLLQDQFEPSEVELLLHQELAVLARG